MRHTTRLSALAVTGVLALAACGGDGSDADTVAPAAHAPTTTVVASTVPSPATTATTAAPATTTTTVAPAPAVAKVPANSATRAQMTAAFEAAGIANASRWALEVEEYRPYPVNDPTFAKLRQNLAKYNPGPGVVDAIISTLSL